jgi:uncharacterized membrane protein YozB (DUF420 family)
MNITFDQGIMLLIETVTFLVFYTIYSFYVNESYHFTNIILTTAFFFMWSLTLLASVNISRALNFPLPEKNI